MIAARTDHGRGRHMRSQPGTYPRIRKALVRAISNTLDSLPNDVRQEIRGRWRWRIAPLLDSDGRTVAKTGEDNI